MIAGPIHALWHLLEQSQHVKIRLKMKQYFSRACVQRTALAAARRPVCPAVSLCVALGLALSLTGGSAAAQGQPAVPPAMAGSAGASAGATPAAAPPRLQQQQQQSQQPAAVSASAPAQAPGAIPGAASSVAAPGAAQDPAAGPAQVFTPTADNYKITPNDLLEIEVFGVSELKRTVRVNTSGQIAMPLIGTLSVTGLTPADAEALIALQYARDFLQDPQVSIFVKEFTTQRITLDGALVKPGIYPLSGQITLLRALALAGGGSQLADLEQVMLFRLTPEGQSLVEKHDVLKIRQGEAPDPMLQSDDVVVVNRNSQRAALRDSLFRDILDTLNPFSSAYRNAVAP